jgi:acetoacetate decarboxylase
MTGPNAFPLKGYTLPLSPTGKAAMIDPPPWYYGGDVMHLVYRGDRAKMAALLPPPLELGPGGGEGVVWFVEWISASAQRPDLAFVNPERSIYHECIVMIQCSYKGETGYYVPYIWVDNDFTLMRGFIQGFPKKLGDVYITRLHDLTPVVGGKKEGAKMKGICVAHGERIVEGSLFFSRPIEPGEVPPVKFYLMRHFPDFSAPERLSVHELVMSTVTDVKVAGAWTGSGEVRFFPSPFEEVADLGAVEVLGGYFYSLGITITGGRMLHRYME